MYMQVIWAITTEYYYVYALKPSARIVLYLPSSTILIRLSKL